MSENGAHSPTGGFRSRPRTIEVVCDWLDPDDGAEPLTARLAINLTNAEIAYLSGMLGRLNNGLLLVDVWTAISPRVLSWNAEAFDMASGSWVPVPPPAEIGADAFRAVDSVITSWLLYELTHSFLGGAERPKEPTPPGSTDDGSGGETSTSPPPTGKPSTRRRRDSTKPLAAT